MEHDMVMVEHGLGLDKPALHQKLRQRVQPIHPLPSARRLQEHPHQLDMEAGIRRLLNKPPISPHSHSFTIRIKRRNADNRPHTAMTYPKPLS